MAKSISIGKALFVGAAAFSFALSAVAAPVATAPGQNKLQCFDGTTDGFGYGGTCTMKANGAVGPATLNNSSGNPSGDYSGVYVNNTNLSGAALGDVKQLGYNYSGTIAPQPGNLSLNIPLDTTGDTLTDTYAFVDAYYCPGTDGHVDVINDANCGIWVNGVEYANWAALVSANPTWTVAGGGALPFIVAERTGSEPSAVWTVNAVKLGKPGK